VAIVLSGFLVVLSGFLDSSASVFFLRDEMAGSRVLSKFINSYVDDTQKDYMERVEREGERKQFDMHSL
jgi:hypothetical protein